MEKPSHNSAADAKTFKKSLQDAGVKEDRVLIGMHTPLHPGSKVLL